MIMLFYFEILLTFVLVTFTLNIKYTDEFVASISKLFVCELNGYNPDNPCSRSDINRFQYPWLSAVSYIIFGSLPIVNLIYAINIEDMKQWFSKIRSHNKYTI